jgi:hypothetical protein
MNTKHSLYASIDRCNELLRGEISAVETYAIAIRRFSEEAAIPTLRSIRDDHADSVELLRGSVARLGGTPTTDSGAWGGFAQTVEKAASLLGDGTALEALRQGEKHGVRQYEDAIADEDGDQESRLLYTEVLMPRLLIHLTQLEGLS